MEPLIKIENLKNFALKGVSLEISEKQIFGIVGSSGAGKTTLMRCITGLLQGGEGRVFVAGEEISQLKGPYLREARKKMGMIFQHFNLFSSKTALDNVLFPMEIAGSANKQKGFELLDLVGLKEKPHCYPAELSGGEKQRVAIARALANQPRVLLCDEATSALDPNTTRSILDLLLSVNQTLGITIVMITHEMEVVKQICHEVAVLDEGQIVEKQSIIDLFSAPSHPTTIRFLQHLLHKVPENFLSRASGKELLRLRFKGKKAEKPIISKMIREIDVEVNILLGGIDSLQKTTVGNLLVELSGTEINIKKARQFLILQGLTVEGIA